MLGQNRVLKGALEGIITVDNAKLWRFKMKLHLTFLLATLAASSALIGGGALSQYLNPHSYCGRRLARMLATICDYDEMRSGSGSMIHPILAPYYRAQEQYITSQKHKHRASLYDLPSHKMEPQTDSAQYTWPIKTEAYGLLSHKTKESEDWPLNKAKGSQDWPWLSANRVRGLDLPSRNKRHVVSECCETPCTVDELITYC